MIMIMIMLMRCALVGHREDRAGKGTGSVATCMHVNSKKIVETERSRDFRWKRDGFMHNNVMMKGSGRLEQRPKQENTQPFKLQICKQVLTEVQYQHTLYGKVQFLGGDSFNDRAVISNI